MVHKLQNEIKKLTVELMKAKDQQEDHLKHLRTLEKSLEKMERQKRQQQAAQVFLYLMYEWHRLTQIHSFYRETNYTT